MGAAAMGTLLKNPCWVNMAASISLSNYICNCANKTMNMIDNCSNAPLRNCTDKNKMPL